MEPVAIATDAFLVVGIKARTTHRIEASPQTAKIPALWRRFFAEQVSAAIAERATGDEIVAVHCDYESNFRGPYSFLIGHRVRTLDQMPAGMAGTLVRSAACLRFTAPDASTESVAATWAQINDFFERAPDYERAYTTEFEIHEADRVEIYVAVK